MAGRKVLRFATNVAADLIICKDCLEMQEGIGVLSLSELNFHVPVSTFALKGKERIRQI